MKYRKKPVVVDAVQWTRDNFDEVEAFNGGMGGMNVDERGYMWVHVFGDSGYSIKARPKDWIIKREDGYLWVCAPDLFEEVYEAV